MDLRRARSIPAVVAALGVVALGLVAYAHTVDDAYIVARYAERWASGLGYTMNDGPPTDGVTGPLLTLGLALAARLGLPVLPVAKLLGLSSTALAVALVVQRVRGQHIGRFPALWAGAALAAQGTLAVWSTAGLETGPAVLVVTLLALELTRRTGPRGRVVGLCLALLAGLRPELALFGGVVLVGVFASDRREGGIALGIAATAVAALIGLRIAAFGHPLPLSFYAKGGDLSHGFGYVALGALVTTGGGGLLLALRATRVARTPFRFLAAALAAHLVGIALSSGDWMPSFRLLASTLPAYALLAAEALRVTPRDLAPRQVIIAAAAFAVAIPAADLAVQLPLVHRAGVARTQRVAEVKEALVSRCETVALVDVGALTYRTELTTLDLAGLTDPAIARLPGGHLDKYISTSTLLARGADCVLLHSSVAPRVDGAGRLRHYAGFAVEERLVRERHFVASYRVTGVFEYMPRYHYVLLERRQHISGSVASRSAPGRGSPRRAAETRLPRPFPGPDGS